MGSDRAGIISGEIVRAARALVRMSREEVAAAAGISLETIKRLEIARGPVRAHPDTIAQIIAAFAERGVSLRYDDDCSELIALHSDESVGGRPAGDGGPEAADLHRLVYISEADTPAGEIDSLLETVRQQSARRNPRLGVTGALWFQDGCFLQALEGPRSSLEALYGIIALDARHRRPLLLEHATVEQRTFPQWMLCRRHQADGLIGVPTLSPAIAPGAALALLHSLGDKRS
jgi:transcriptional regulator with XRE-family HTH domain